MIEAAASHLPSNDGTWIFAMQHAAERFCAEVPSSSAVLAGPRADKIAAGIGVPTVAYPDAPPYGGSVSLKMRDDSASRAWLARVQGDRWFHLVVVGKGWQGLVDRQPIMVSWAGADGVVPALQTRAEHNLTLGYFSGSRGDGLRATPLEAALAIGELLPRT
jgi:hypothetical protein